MKKLLQLALILATVYTCKGGDFPEWKDSTDLDLQNKTTQDITFQGSNLYSKKYRKEGGRGKRGFLGSTTIKPGETNVGFIRFLGYGPTSFMIGFAGKRHKLNFNFPEAWVGEPDKKLIITEQAGKLKAELAEEAKPIMQINSYSNKIEKKPGVLYRAFFLVVVNVTTW